MPKERGEFMRRVACYVATSALQADESPDQALGATSAIVSRWIDAKGIRKGFEATDVVRLPDGREGRLVCQQYRAAGVVHDIQLTEPIDSGSFLTRISLGVRDRVLTVFVELRAGGESLLVRPVPVDVRCPEVYRTILESRDWFAGGAPVRATPMQFDGPRGASTLVRVLQHHDRNLPVVAVSTMDGNSVVPDLAAMLARDLAGLAIIATVDEAASWTLTQELGKEWSVYLGAVRLYWPFRGHSHADAFDHPLWTAARLVGPDESGRSPANRLRTQLRRQLFAISTYTISEPAALIAIRTEASEAHMQELRDRAEGGGEWQQLAEAYAEENTQLRASVAEHETQIEDLQAKLANLELAARYRHEPEDEALAPEDLPRASTLREAVASARQRFARQLTFGADVERGIDTVSSDAGPPDRVFQYLQSLAEMTDERNSNGLGKDMIVWLRDAGVKCSNETEGTLNNAAEMRQRRWDDGAGRARFFEQHLKPKDGTHPDHCVRIYFDFDDVSKKTIVGWVGRHPGT
jgi:hypothetical protein